MFLRNIYKIPAMLNHPNTRLMAGHSKWANIKHIKAAKDAEKSRTYDRMARLMRVAIRESNSADPKTNSKLAQLIDQAKSVNMPLERIQNVIKTAAASKEEGKHVILEIKGPGGCFFIVEAITSNLNRTKQGFNTILRKHFGSWADGASKQLFSYKGLVKVNPLQPNQTLEAAVDHGIEIGAEDVQLDESSPESEKLFVFVCDSRDLQKVHRGVASLGYTVRESGLEFIPLTRVGLSESDMEAASKMYEKLDADPEVIKVHVNIE